MKTTESMAAEETKVMIAAEDTVSYNFNVGDEVRLGYNHERFVIVDENNRIVPAELVANMTRELALKLADIQAKFRIIETEGTVLKAEMVNPYNFVHHSDQDWVCLN